MTLSLAWMTLLGTWFGAGTILAAADEVRDEGMRAAGLEPIGEGFCLLFAGLFIAAPMWRERLLTVPDLFRRRFGATAEMVASLIMVPSFFGWIAAQSKWHWASATCAQSFLSPISGSSVGRSISVSSLPINNGIGPLRQAIELASGEDGTAELASANIRSSTYMAQGNPRTLR